MQTLCFSFSYNKFSRCPASVFRQEKKKTKHFCSSNASCCMLLPPSIHRILPLPGNSRLSGILPLHNPDHPGKSNVLTQVNPLPDTFRLLTRSVPQNDGSTLPLQNRKNIETHCKDKPFMNNSIYRNGFFLQLF